MSESTSDPLQGTSKNVYIDKERRLKQNYLLLEFSVWVIFAVLPLTYIYLKEIDFAKSFRTIVKSSTMTQEKALLNQLKYLCFTLSVGITLFPLLYRLIFGLFPFEALRKKFSKYDNLDLPAVPVQSKYVLSEDGRTLEDRDYKYTHLMGIKESIQIAERIFSRSGVYLLVGCLIAFGGAAIFYSPFFPSSRETDVWKRLVDYLPRFGALFFIEFIAFFFLKQYRIMLEEYRYYEAVKRKRQDDFNMIKYILDNKDNLEMVKLTVEVLSKGGESNKMSKDQTTEVLELQKQVDQDMDIFAKFVEVVKLVKK
ncbi:hypothetical protein [Dyadobacter sp. CY326]|uniref:hypothetical protein n=1 Tax=Dyadobacter sp. CY326 TaxID=2907300 RepID=UPI001F3A8A8A|nr:hypothetical protein [Dyadobacter sp. CY326]MCE7066690.1 hypothetical protein [Dyadobacter sp. CY326]